MKLTHPTQTRSHCDCGRPTVMNPDGTPKYVLSKDAICERCHRIAHEWKWSRYNPDCLKEGDGIAKNGISWTAWGGIAYCPLPILQRHR